MGEEDRAEHLPYVRRGIAVIGFDLTGPTPTDQIDAAFVRAANRFREADGGRLNALAAFEYAMQHMPEVDPRRIYAAGHSSAGAVVLGFAAAEPRLAGVAAYAPLVDHRAFHGRGALEELERLEPGIVSWIDTLSPVRFARHIKAPVLLTHSQQDRVVDAEAQDLADAGQRRVLVLLGVLREQLVGDQAAVGRAGDDVGEGAPAVDPEFPLPVAHRCSVIPTGALGLRRASCRTGR